MTRANLASVTAQLTQIPVLGGFSVFTEQASSATMQLVAKHNMINLSVASNFVLADLFFSSP